MSAIPRESKPRITLRLSAAPKRSRRVKRTRGDYQQLTKAVRRGLSHVLNELLIGEDILPFRGCPLYRRLSGKDRRDAAKAVRWMLENRAKGGAA